MTRRCRCCRRRRLQHNPRYMCRNFLQQGKKLYINFCLHSSSLPEDIYFCGYEKFEQFLFVHAHSKGVSVIYFKNLYTKNLRGYEENL